MKKLFTYCAVTALMATALAGCADSTTSNETAAAAGADDAKIRISIVGKGISDFGTLIKNGALAAGEEFGAEVTWNAPDTESLVRVNRWCPSSVGPGVAQVAVEKFSVLLPAAS